jgi:phage gpG-like protein
LIIEATIDQSELDNCADEIAAQIRAAVPAVQAAMAEMYRDIVIGNLGPSGVDRPITWEPLSNRSAVGRAYIQKVGRTYATLYETGKLASAIRMDNSSVEQSTVSVSDEDCEYAVKHQYGFPPQNLPARPYFPFDPMTGETTPYTLAAMQQVAQETLNKELEAGL